MAFSFFICGAANASIGDTLRPYAEVSYEYEGNLLRLPPAQLNGSNGTDSYRRLDVGLLIEKSLGRQHVGGNLKFSRVTFDRFTAFNNDARDAQATWNWQLGNHLDGNIGTQYTQALPPFAETRSSIRSVKTQKNEFVDARWRFHPSWSVHAGFTHQTLGYDVPSQQLGNRVEDAQDVGLDYLPTSASSVGLVFRRTRENYPVQQQLGTLVVGNSYRQNEYKLKADWILSGKSRLQFLGGTVQREYDFFQSRNKTVPSVRITGNFQPSGKVNMILAGYHEISPSDDLTVNYSVNNGVSLATTWDMLAKVHLEGLLRRENHDFNSASSFSLLLPVNRQEKSRFGSVQLTYSPRLNLKVTVSLFRDDLDSTSAQRSYRAEGVVIGLRSVF